MKSTIFAVVSVVSMVAMCALYGWLESSVNMMEGLGELFQPGATTVLFSPILLLFIALGLAVYMGGSMAAIIAATLVGGRLLRSDRLTVSKSFARYFVIAGVICQFVFILLAIRGNAPFLRDRPRIHPNPYLVAVLAAAIAGFNLWVGAAIMRKWANVARH